MKNSYSSNVQFSFSKFETIAEQTDGQLVGGFSSSFSGSSLSTEEVGSNNCAGGNCVSGCGDGQNSGCNTVSGCGTIA